MTIRAAYDGVYRINGWFPITVDLSNTGVDIQGDLEWSLSNRTNEPVFRMPIDLPRGSQKRLQLSMYSRDFNRRAVLRIIADQKTLIEQGVDLTPIEPNDLLVVVVSSDLTLLNALTQIQLPNVDRVVVQHIGLAELPEQTAALRPVSLLVLHDVDSAQLSVQQREAIHTWLILGGQLLVSGGPQGQATAAGLADLLPAKISPGLQDGSIEAILALGKAALPSGAQTAPLNQLEPSAEARAIIGDGLVWERQLGSGRSMVTAFDLALLRGWTDELRLWQKLIIIQPLLYVYNPNYDILRTTLQLAGLQLPPTAVILSFLLFYILLIGPINYLVLRRLKRMEWAWLSIPLLVVCVVVGLYALGIGARGGEPKLSQLSIIQASEGEQQGYVSAYIGLFSPFRSSYTIKLAPQILVLDSDRWNGNNPSDAVRINETGVEIPNALVDVSSIRVFNAERSMNVSAIVGNLVESTFDNASQQSGTIQNRSSQILEDVIVVRGETFSSLGTLQAGETRSFNLSTNGSVFPWGVALNETGIFNRRTILNTLFNGDHMRLSNAKPFPDDASYILAWTKTPLIPVIVNGVEQAQQAACLYIVRLR